MSGAPSIQATFNDDTRSVVSAVEDDLLPEGEVIGSPPCPSAWDGTVGARGSFCGDALEVEDVVRVYTFNTFMTWGGDDEHEYAYYHFDSILAYMIANGVHVDTVNSSGFALMDIAVYHSFTSRMRVLVSHGANVNRRVAFDTLMPLLHFAIGMYVSAPAKLLIEMGADLELRDSETGDTAWLCIARNAGSCMSHDDLLKACLAGPNGPVDVNAQTNEGDTAAHLVARDPHLHYRFAHMKILVLAGVNLKLRNGHNERAVDVVNERTCHRRLVAFMRRPHLFRVLRGVSRVPHGRL